MWNSGYLDLVLFSIDCFKPVISNKSLGGAAGCPMNRKKILKMFVNFDSAQNHISQHYNKASNQQILLSIKGIVNCLNSQDMGPQ